MKRTNLLRRKQTITILKPSIALDCTKCNRTVENCNGDTKTVLCWRCVANMIAPPAIPKALQLKTKEKRPRGWQFRKRYVAPSGIVYSFGKEVR